jgi:biuret amidohydrolase
MIHAHPFDWPYDLRLDPARTAFLAIDLQHDFVSPEGYFARLGYSPEALSAVIPNVNRISAAMRRAGALIIHTRQGYRADKADMTPYEVWRRERNGLAGTVVMLRGQPGFEIDAMVDVDPADVIIDKTANGSFTHTDLDHVLRARGITHLVLAGVTTEVCVHTTLREACDRNYQCLTVTDACASGDVEMHEAAIRMVTVENGLFGVIAATDAVVAGFDGLAALDGTGNRT